MVSWLTLVYQVPPGPSAAALLSPTLRTPFSGWSGPILSAASQSCTTLSGRSGKPSDQKVSCGWM